MTEEGICPRTLLGFLEKTCTRTGRAEFEEDPKGKGKWIQGAVEILRKQRNIINKMGEANSLGGIAPTHLPMSNIPHENVYHWNFETDEVPHERKNLPPGKKGTARSKLKKCPSAIPVEQMKDFNLSENSQKSSQKDSKQEKFQFCRYPHNEALSMEEKEFQKSSMETGFNENNNSLRLLICNHPLTDPSLVDRQAGSCPGLQREMPLNHHWPDGDFCKGRSEPQSNSSSVQESNNRETLSFSNCRAKYGNRNIEGNLTDESDLSEDENVNNTLLSYFKKMDLNLKPEVIEDVEDVEELSSDQPSEVFPYPDFLPPPFNTIDLHKLALSKSENWKLILDPVEHSTEQLISRLLELERIQHLTILKERPDAS